MDDSAYDSHRQHKRNSSPPLPIGATAVGEGVRLRSYQVGALPLINHFFQRLGLEEMLKTHLPPDDVRQTIPTERIILLLVRNVLVSREPMYAIPEWAARHAPELFDMYHCEIASLPDDRLGSCLARLFHATTPQLILALVRRATDLFQVSLEELHNDSTSVAFYGDYPAAKQPRRNKQREQPAITWGHSKDHRPDLKQLLFTMTLCNDGGVPIYFTVDNGNTTDDTTHRRTWEMLVEIVGSPNFLYVADCKLASRENLQHISARNGRFLTVLPRTRGEDAVFRARLRTAPDSVVWHDCWTRIHEPDDPRWPVKSDDDPDDLIRVCLQEETTSDGYRLLWFHSRRKAACDVQTRGERCQRAIQELQDLQMRMMSPRTRYRDRAKVEEAVRNILTTREMESLLSVEIILHERETFHKQGPGRPNDDSTYRREIQQRFELKWHMNNEAWQIAAADDGVFPLLTNDRQLTPRELIEAYKRQPKIEKRFHQLKSDYNFAPVFLKTPERVVGLFTIYFLALLVQALMERELRRALAECAEKAQPTERRWEGSVEVYPEGRRSRRPTVRHALDMLEHIRRYDLLQSEQAPDSEPHELHDELTPAQQRLLTLFGVAPQTYAR